MNYCAVKGCLNAATYPIAFASTVGSTYKYEYRRVCNRHKKIMRHELTGKPGKQRK